jgi:hypothetical protein
VDELVEGVLPVGAGLAKVNLTCGCSVVRVWRVKKRSVRGTQMSV